MNSKKANQATGRELFWYIALMIITSSCATVVSPSGGPKDAAPPKVTGSAPENYSTGFVAAEAVIAFDEFVQLHDLQNQLIISPPITEKPKITAKGKTIRIVMNDSLKKNTTYTFNFGDAIRDVTENNAIDGFQYVFSTGDYLDSLKISGKTADAFTGKTEKDILVMIYLCDDFESCDSFPSSRLPDYFAKTNKEGMFMTNNIKEGKYKIFALKDENRNYLFDLPNEKIAFENDLIEPASRDTAEINLWLFEEEHIKQPVFKDTSVFASDTTSSRHDTTNATYYGKLNLKIVIPDADAVYIVQFLDTREIAVKEDTIAPGEQTLLYEYIKPGDYRVRVIHDVNFNGKWDTGNYNKKTQPEKVFYYPEKITIRSNWDLQLEWKLELPLK